MMDYYSQFPAPSYEECKKETIAVVRLNYNQNEKELDNLVTEAFMDSKVLEFDENRNPKIKYSFSGWHVFGKKDVITSCDKIVKRKRQEKLNRMIRGPLRPTYLPI